MPKREISDSLGSMLSIKSNPSSSNVPSLNVQISSANTSSSSKPPEQKRRRVTRACDNCRQKKVKCDGKQPCIHCTVYSYNCTYDQPNIRNKKNTGIPIPSYPQNNPALSSIVNSNANLQKSAALIGGKTSPNLMLAQNIVNLLLPKLKLNLLEEKPQYFDFDKFNKIFHYVQNKTPNHQVNLGEIADLYRDGPTPSASPASRNERQSSVSSNDEGREIKLILPSKEVALQLIYTTWYKACVLFRFYHRPSLLEEVELLYSLDPFNYTDRQQKFLPFLYSILACGSLFSKLSQDVSNNESLEDDGFKYFLEARKLIDITNVGDIISIQTIVMMIMYLQCSARLSTCYSYIGIALRSAVKEGLHRNLSIFQNSRRKLDPIEVDTRKRLFFTIYKMDIYINSLLGLPRSINEDEFDQELPEDLDDENITRDGYLYENQNGRVSSSGCANYHTKLMFIISHTVKELYPIKGKNQLSPSHIHSKVTEIELELKHWLEHIPIELKPTDPSDPESSKHVPEKFVLANYYIHLAFLNCQITLYRPFIHFISNGIHFQASDPRSLIRGRNCIKVARMVVKLANKMIDQNLLVGTYWFSMYTIFFSIACLIYYFHFANYNNNQNDGRNGVNYAGVLFDDDLNIDMIKKDIEIGKKVLDCLKNNSNASLRIYNILNNLFEQLNRRTANTSRVKSNPLMTQSAFEANDESVRTTFQNFDRMNDFNGQSLQKSQSQIQPPTQSFDESPLPKTERPHSTHPDFYNSFASKNSNDVNPSANTNKGIKEEGDDYLKAFLLKNNFQDNFTNSSQPIKSQPSTTQASKTSQSQSQPNKETSPQQQFANPPLNEPANADSVNSSNTESVDYLPGVIDKLDAQIFGRILPPYMLEKNAKRYEGSQMQPQNDGPLSFDVNDNQLQQPILQATQPGQPNINLQNLNLDEFDLAMLGDINSLDYLDPFNPIDAESPSNLSKKE